MKKLFISALLAGFASNSCSSQSEDNANLNLKNERELEGFEFICINDQTGNKFNLLPVYGEIAVTYASGETEFFDNMRAEVDSRNGTISFIHKEGDLVAQIIPSGMDSELKVYSLSGEEGPIMADAVSCGRSLNLDPDSTLDVSRVLSERSRNTVRSAIAANPGLVGINYFDTSFFNKGSDLDLGLCPEVKTSEGMKNEIIKSLKEPMSGDQLENLMDEVWYAEEELLAYIDENRGEFMYACVNGGLSQHGDVEDMIKTFIINGANPVNIVVETTRRLYID